MNRSVLFYNAFEGYPVGNNEYNYDAVSYRDSQQYG